MDHPDVIVRVHGHRRHVAENFSRRYLRERRIDLESRKVGLRAQAGNEAGCERQRQQNFLQW